MASKPAFDFRAMVLVVLAAAALIPGCARATKTAGETLGQSLLTKRVVSARQVAGETYRIRPGDKLEILLSSRPGSGLHVSVLEDGSAFYTPVGSLQAAGKSIPELEKEIQDKLTAERAPTSGIEPGHSIEISEEITPQQALSQIYPLQRGDQLQLSVWDHADLNQIIQVREDGTAAFPLIGAVTVADRMIPELEQEITERLDRDYIANPQVSIRLVGAQFSIFGMGGGASGTLPIESSMDLVTALSKAGDLDILRSSRVEIIRHIGGKRYAIQTEVDRVLRGKEPNIPILPRDAIYLQTSDTGRVAVHLLGAKFTALGELASPGVHPIEGPLDILTAVSMAGGITKFGSSRIEVIRAVGNERLVIRVDLNRILQGRDPNFSVFPRDAIRVKRRLF